MTKFTERDSLNITECECECECEQSSYGMYSYPAYGTQFLALAWSCIVNLSSWSHYLLCDYVSCSTFSTSLYTFSGLLFCAMCLTVCVHMLVWLRIVFACYIEVKWDNVGCILDLQYGQTWLIWPLSMLDTANVGFAHIKVLTSVDLRWDREGSSIGNRLQVWRPCCAARSAV